MMWKIAAFLMLVASVSALADPSCSLNRLTSADMLITDHGLVTGVLIGTEKLPFVVDTRLTTSLMFEGTVMRLGRPLQPTADFYIDIDNHPVFERTDVPWLMLGTIRYGVTPFIVARSPANGANGTMSGVLGADLLRSYDVEIDPAAGKLNLYSQDHCDGKVVYWAKEYLTSPVHMRFDEQIEMDVELDGQTLHAILSTGLSDNLIEMPAAAKRFGLDEHAAGMQAVDPAKDLGNYPVPRYSFPFKQLKFGALTINNPKIDVIVPGTLKRGARATESDFADEMFIGMNFLRKLHIYIAYREDKLYYTVVP